MSLYQKFLRINDWKYYEEMPIDNYREAIKNPVEFIRQYFGYGGKADFLLDSIYFYRTGGEERAKHVVNTYFLGLYLTEKLTFLQPTNMLFLEDRRFLWAWFLCALYHDAFFDETQGANEEIDYGYCESGKGFLYSGSTIHKYFNKNANVATSYDGRVHFDHGIVAASKLYKNYIKTKEFAIEYGGQTETDFYTKRGILIGDHLKINQSTLYSLRMVARVIACHNIFVCSPGQEEKYKGSGLSHLIPSNAKFRKMPHRRHRLENDYEKLYYLLCLTDALEPSKRGLSLENLNFDIHSGEEQYSIDVSGETNTDYIATIKSLATWLTGIEVTEDGRHIKIEMENERLWWGRAVARHGFETKRL